MYTPPSRGGRGVYTPPSRGGRGVCENTQNLKYQRIAPLGWKHTVIRKFLFLESKISSLKWLQSDLFKKGNFYGILAHIHTILSSRILFERICRSLNSIKGIITYRLNNKCITLFVFKDSNKLISIKTLNSLSSIFQYMNSSSKSSEVLKYQVGQMSTFTIRLQ